MSLERWTEGDHFAIDGTSYMLQCEHVRGEPPYYSVYVFCDGTPCLELINERSLGCSAARARRMAEQHARGETRGMSIKRLGR